MRCAFCGAGWGACSGGATGPEKVRRGGTARKADPWEAKTLAERPCRSRRHILDVARAAVLDI